MSYEITANRKRPAEFDTLVGQEFVIATLKNSLATGRIAHAYLFSGPRGVGKTSAARILAKALNCEKEPTPTPCGTCSPCREIAQGSALDVIEIDGASNTSVNDVREIKDEVLFAPASSRYKVYIIDEVHMLSNSAFNALLKTIEEPPPYIVFVFATTEIHKVPQTIRSRCQQFSFRLIPLDTILSKLKEASVDMGIQAEEAALLWIAKEATGSLRDAYTVFDQVISFADGNLTLEKIQDKLGLTGLDRLNTLTELLTAGKGSEALTLFDEVVSGGVAIEQFTLELTDYYRSLLFLKLGIHKPSLLGYTVDRFPPSVVRTLSVRQIEKALSLLLELYRNLRYTINGRFEVELVLSRLADLKNYLSREELLERIQGLRKELRFSSTTEGATPRLDSENVASPEASTSETSESGPSDTVEQVRIGQGDLVPEQWKAIINSLKRKKLTLSTTLNQAESWRLDGDTLIILFRNKFSADLVVSDLALVSQKAREVLGREVEVRVSCDTGKAKRVEGTAAQTDPLDSSEDTGGEGVDRVEIARKVFRGEILE